MQCKCGHAIENHTYSGKKTGCDLCKCRANIVEVMQTEFEDKITVARKLADMAVNVTFSGPSGDTYFLHGRAKELRDLAVAFLADNATNKVTPLDP